MKKVAISREDDDNLAKSRISLGELKSGIGFYIVFRGEPEDVLSLLREALAVAEAALPAGQYSDRRGRPQG